MQIGRSGWMTNVLAEPKSRGFLWGVAAATAAYFLWPSLQGALRPAARTVVRGTMAAGDRFRYTVSRAKEALEDVVAEAQFERAREVVAPDVEAGNPDLGAPEGH